VGNFSPKDGIIYRTLESSATPLLKTTDAGKYKCQSTHFAISSFLLLSNLFYVTEFLEAL
jgi:hypothetical protein